MPEFKTILLKEEEFNYFKLLSKLDNQMRKLSEEYQKKHKRGWDILKEKYKLEEHKMYKVDIDTGILEEI